MVLRPSLIKTSVFYYLHLILGGLGLYTTALTTLTTTLMAIERCLYMTRRRWANSSRVFKPSLVMLLLPIPLDFDRILLSSVTNSNNIPCNTLLCSNFLNLSSSLSKHSSPSTANSSQRDFDVYPKRAIHKHGKVQEISLYNSPYLGFLLFELFSVHCQRFSTLAVRAIAEIDCCL